MNFYYTFLILLSFTFFLNYILIKKNLLLDSKKISIHKSFTQNKNKVSYVGGLIILVACIFFWKDKSNNFILFLTLMFMIGIFSDLGLLESPIKRFFLQSVVILSFLIIFDLKINSIRLEFFDYFLENKIFNLFFVTFCILIVINGTNFMDGLNTLVIGYYILILISLLFILSNNVIIFSNKDLITVMITSLLVILIFNIFGKIYLGDNGAYLISFIIAVILIDIAKNNLNVSPYYVANLLWYPAFENFFSIIRKILQKKSPMSPDNQHLHQLLFIFLKNFNKFNTNFINSSTACLINLFNIIIFMFATINYSSTKIQILIILTSSLFYSISYFILKKRSVRVSKKNLI